MLNVVRPHHLNQFLYVLTIRIVQGSYTAIAGLKFPNDYIITQSGMNQRDFYSFEFESYISSGYFIWETVPRVSHGKHFSCSTCWIDCALENVIVGYIQTVKLKSPEVSIPFTKRNTSYTPSNQFPPTFLRVPVIKPLFLHVIQSGHESNNVPHWISTGFL